MNDNTKWQLQRYESHIGKVVKDHKDNLLGTLTQVYYEDNKFWGRIDEDYDVCLDGCEYIMVLMSKNTITESDYIRTCPQY